MFDLRDKATDVQRLSAGRSQMPPIREINLDNGINILDSNGVRFVMTKADMENRLFAVSGNLAKKESRFNEWLQLQQPFSYIYPLADYEPDHRVRQVPPVLNVWEWIDGTNIVVVHMWIAVYIYTLNPLTFNSRIQNKEIGPITGEWWI